MKFSSLLLYCRPGFEKECAADIQQQMDTAQVQGYIKAKPDSGYVFFMLHDALEMDALNRAFNFHAQIFARQCILADDIVKDLPVDDRITPLCERLASWQMQFCEVWLETPDTNDGKEVSAFCKKFTAPFEIALKKRGWINPHSEWRLHAFFLSSAAVYLGVSSIHNSAAMPMGIPRLHMPRSAPSRSTLKLEEAFKIMLSEHEREKYLRNGMSAVDLGASPGGWTWQLVQRGLRVIAIDNGKMDQALMDSGLVEHVRADGFVYTPPKPVDWLLCDMVERPLHIARLMARWLVDGHCRHAVFNLKLPMKQRYAMVMDCRELIASELARAGLNGEIRMKQLYHDREEITCIVLRT
jgi:23S rRNA (cytidine2498-2'-O)-methyltransferase